MFPAAASPTRFTQVKGLLVSRIEEPGSGKSQTQSQTGVIETWLNPGRAAALAKIRSTTTKSLTLEQAQDLLRAAAGSRLYGYVVLSVTTALRTEELRALKWNKVGLDTGTIAVYRPFYSGKHQKYGRNLQVIAGGHRVL